MKRIYRHFIDLIEENSTGCADLIAVNSTFTAYEFHQAFQLVGSQVIPSVLNPTVENDLLVDDYLVRKQAKSCVGIEYVHGADFVFVSINRFERAKRIEVALGALHLLKKRIAGNYKKDKITVKLVIAGGYDLQVKENIDYLEELKKLAIHLEIVDDVVFRTSISKEERFALISRADALVYTPGREHFGIVPIESMALGRCLISS